MADDAGATARQKPPLSAPEMKPQLGDPEQWQEELTRCVLRDTAGFDVIGGTKLEQWNGKAPAVILTSRIGGAWMKWGRARAVLATIQVLALSSLASLSPQARAQESRPAIPGGKFAESCSDDLYDPAARRGAREMPPAIRARQSDLMQQLHPDNFLTEDRRIERGCMPVAEAWPHRANLYLLPSETIVREFNDSGGWSDTPRSLAIGLVRVSDDAASLSVVAKTAQPLERTGELERFDFASYRLNESETAFGLRSYFNTTYAGGGGRDEVLELFRVKDGVIETILRTLMASSNFVHGEQRGDPKGAVISVLPTKTNGVFDLKKSVRGGRAAIFRWNGHAYETHDGEPVECFNDRCDDIKRELALPSSQEKEAGQLMGAAFAFANRAGTELLVTDENASQNNAVVKTFSKAVCPGNKVLDVRFVSHQSRAEETNGRATSRNFNNIAGSVFHIVQGQVEADEACLLAPETYIKDTQLLTMKVTKAKIKARQNRQDGALRCDARTKGDLVPQQGRAPEDCWQLAQIDADGRLLAVLYEPRQKDLLAALVLEVGEKHFVYEMPAKADPNSSWRAGDEGHFDPTTLAPLFVIENDRDGSWDIGISWAGEEGASLGAYRSSAASRLKKVVSGYVYWYPE